MSAESTDVLAAIYGNMFSYELTIILWTISVPRNQDQNNETNLKMPLRVTRDDVQAKPETGSLMSYTNFLYLTKMKSRKIPAFPRYG